MSKNRFLTRLASGALVVAVAAGGSFLPGGVANAAAPPGTLGTITFTPPGGTDTDAPTAHTSGPCPAASDAADLHITGPVGAANPTFPPAHPFPVVVNNDASFSTTVPFTQPFREIFKDAAKDAADPFYGGTGLIQTGEYFLTSQCIDNFTGTQVFGTFTTSLYFTSPTAWQSTDPTVATSISTTLAVTPASPVHSGDSVTLTATVSPPAAAAGQVQFMDGTTNIGNPMNVFFSNSVSITTTTLAVGSHPLAVKFIPRPSLVNVKGSTSNTVDFVVNGGTAVATTTALVVTPNSPANADTQETLTATVTPPAAGSVQFLDGTTSIGTPVTVSGGTASTTTTLVPGSHSLTAVFTSTDPAFTGSISPPVTYVVNNPAGAQDTTTTLTASPVGPVDPGTAVTLNAALTPGGAAGTVQFLDGTTTIGGPVTVAGGTASTTTSTLTAGSHQLTAEFTPDNPAAFNASTSPAVTLVVNTPTVAMATRTVLVVTPASPVAANTVETLKATLTPSATAGSVQFKDRTTAIGNPVPVTNGSASTTTTLASGTHSLTAVFTPTDPAAFKPSKSRAVSLRVNGPGGGQPLDQAIAKVVTDLKGAIQRQPSLQPFLQPIIQFLQFFIQFVHSGQLLHVGPR